MNYQRDCSVEEGFTTIKLTMRKPSAHMIMTNMVSHDHVSDDRGDDEQTTDDCEVPTGVPMMAKLQEESKEHFAGEKENEKRQNKRAARVPSQAIATCTAKPPARTSAGLTDKTIQKQPPVRGCDVQERKER